MGDLPASINVSRETFLKLKQYQAILEKWQKRMNLIAPSTVENCWERHFLDSLQIMSHLPEEASTLYDLGSGAGFPGMVLAIAQSECLDVTLVESNQKKCLFLENVSRETMTKVTLLRERIEDVGCRIDVDVITARGLAPLPELLEYFSKLSNNKETVGIFLKGKEFQDEIERAQKNWHFCLDIYPSITDSNGRILKISSLRKKVL